MSEETAPMTSAAPDPSPEHVPNKPEANKKRHRIQYSCGFCRQRKLKCDRNQPCNNCVKRGNPGNCTYIQSTARERREHGSATNYTMQNRIRQLESLVVSLMEKSNSGGSNAASSINGQQVHQQLPRDDSNLHNGDSSGESIDRDQDAKPDQVIGSFGHININETETSYVGGSHWAAVLDNIKEVREYFENENSNDIQPQPIINEPKSQAPAFLFGTFSSLSKADMHASIPNRAISDRLISRYFNSKDAAVLLIHAPTFRKEYEEFWANPEGTPVIWIGLLYGMMCLAIAFYQRTGDQPPELGSSPDEVAAMYKSRTAQCLVLANYTKPGPYTLETLVLHLQCEFFQRKDAQVSVWVILGVIVRLAMRMGYHRDSDNYPNISAFDGEMRRRVWAFISQLDVLVSFQMGLPSMIQKGQSDTAPPHNLFDEDFSREETLLPPSRLVTDPTEVSYTIVKRNLCVAFGLVADQTYLMEPTSYDDVMKLDNALKDARSSIPPHLRMRNLDDSITDPPYLIMRRYNLELLFHKSRCVLHRKYLAEGRSNPQYAYSREACVTSAMELLRHQQDIFTETQPGGVLYRDRWFISSLASHDFILAAMIVCLELHHHTEGELLEPKPIQETFSDFQHHETLLRALEASHHIWMSVREHSWEANRACKALTIMLRKAGSTDPTIWPNHAQPLSNDLSTAQGTPPTSIDPSLSGIIATPGVPELFSESMFPQAVEPVLQATQQLAGSSDVDHFGDLSIYSSLPPDFMMGVIEAPTMQNWDVWDNQFQGPNVQLSNQVWVPRLDYPPADDTHNQTGP